MFFPVDGCKKCLRGSKCSERVVKGILLQCCDVFLFCQPHPQGQEPHSQLCCLLVHFSRNASTYTAHRHADTNEPRHRYTQIYTHTSSPSESWLLAAGAKLNAALPVHLCVPSLLCSPPLSSSLWLPRTRRPTVQWDTIYHCRNNYWRHFIVRKFQANSSPHLSLFIFLLPHSPSVFLSCPPAIPSFPSLPLLCLFAWLPVSSIAGQTPISPSPSL